MDFSTLETALQEAPLIGFSELSCIPEESGIYAAWLNGNQPCLYVGKADRLRSRLRSHYSGQRGGDQFCLYVYDQHIFPLRSSGLSTAQINALTSRWIRANVRFRWIEVPEQELRGCETYLCKAWQPILNPR